MLTKSSKIDIMTVDLKKSQSKPTSSVPSSRSHSSSATRSNTLHRNSRIVEEDFNPLTRQVAVAAKSHFRVLTIYDNLFPPQGVGRFEYGWKAIKTMVNNSKNTNWKLDLKWGNDDRNSPQQIVKFVSILFSCWHC